MIYEKLKSVVQSVMNEIGDSDNNHYIRYLTMGCDGLRELSFLLPQSLKTVYIEYDSTKGYIDLPLDCVSISKVGYVDCDKLVQLYENYDMPVSKTYDSCGNLIQAKSPCTCGVCNDCCVTFNNFWYNGGFYPLYGFTWFGIGGGQNYPGSYREITETNRLQFSSDFHKDSVYLEYKTNGLNPTENGDMLVPEPAYMALKEFIHWRLDKNNQAAYRNYRNAKYLLKTRIFAFSIDDMREYSNRHNTQTVKF